MSHVITGEALEALVADDGVIQNGLVSNADGVKYDFRMGNRLLKAKFRVPVEISEVADSGSLVVAPGEVVFVMSAEVLKLPADTFAQLSPKRSLSQAGILVLGGFEIDPGYQGHLLMGLYNFSSTEFALTPNRKLIAATFYRLIGDEVPSREVRPTSLADFPEELIQMMARYEPVKLNTIQHGLEELRSDLETIRRELANQNLWYDRLSESLKRHDEQIGKVISGLDKEKTSREMGESEVRVAIAAIEKNFTFIRGAAWAIGAILTAIAIPLVIQLLDS